MRVHVLQHVGFESPAHVLDWARDRRQTLVVHRLDLAESLPPAADVDLLIVMGGPMGADDEATHPVIAGEKTLIADVLARGGRVAGICLGAQILARSLGAAVAPQGFLEIGWHDVTRTRESALLPLLDGVPERFKAFHWHGDAFALPPGATPLFRSEGCATQGFLAADGRALGLQFHPEVDLALVESMLAHEGHELAHGGAWVQDRRTILDGCAAIPALRAVLFSLLDALAPTPSK